MKKYFYAITILCLLFIIGGSRNQEFATSISHLQNANEEVFVSGMGCSNLNCTDSSHYHDCPTDCKDYNHYHNCNLDCTEVIHHHNRTTEANELEHHYQKKHHGSNHH